jgi:hypothetical protein
MPAILLLAAALSLPAPKADDVRRIDETLVACGTRHTLSASSDPKRGIGCARDKIVAYFNEAAKADSKAKVIVDRFETSGERTGGTTIALDNVYLVLPGTDAALASTVFIVSGHYDSRCSDVMDAVCDAPGADDDGSGTTVAIAAGRLLAGRPRRATIVLAALAGEEQGLFGGKRLLDWVKAEGDTVGGVLNNDIVGAVNGAADKRMRVFCGEDDVAPARQLGVWLDEFVGPDLIRLVFRQDRFARGSDHLPFLESGFPAVRFTEPREDYRHEHQTPRVEDGVAYGDLLEFVDFPLVARVAHMNAQSALRLANAPAPPSSAFALGAVKQDSTVTFTAPDDAERASFEILSRPTTDFRWTVVSTLAAAGTVTIPGRTIDDVEFAVRSVGKNGQRSIAVPAAARLKP